MSNGVSRIGGLFYPPHQMYMPGQFYGQTPFYNPMMMRGFQSPIDEMQSRFYQHEESNRNLVNGAIGGGATVSIIGGILGAMLAGAKTGAAAGTVAAPGIGTLTGAALGATAGAILGIAAGAIAGKTYGDFTAVHHDAEDDGVMNGSPLYFGVNAHG